LNKDKLIKKAKTAIITFKIEETVEYVKKALQAGATPLEIIDEGLAKGLMILGAQFEKGEIFLLELISGGEAMRQAMELLHPLLEAQQEVKRIGRVLIGTIEGDMQDLGKNIVASVLQAAGFEVIDLGKDVPIETFVERIKELHPDIVGISALLSTTIHKQGELIKRLKQEGLREKVKILIGGAPTSPEWKLKIGADGYAADAISTVIEAKKLMEM